MRLVGLTVYWTIFLREEENSLAAFQILPTRGVFANEHVGVPVLQDELVHLGAVGRVQAGAEDTAGKTKGNFDLFLIELSPKLAFSLVGNMK